MNHASIRFEAPKRRLDQGGYERSCQLAELSQAGRRLQRFDGAPSAFDLLAEHAGWSPIERAGFEDSLAVLAGLRNRWEGPLGPLGRLKVRRHLRNVSALSGFCTDALVQATRRLGGTFFEESTRVRAGEYAHLVDVPVLALDAPHVYDVVWLDGVLPESTIEALRVLGEDWSGTLRELYGACQAL